MLTTRETASLLLMGAIALTMIVVPKFRRHMAPSFRAVLRAVFQPRLVGLYAVLLVVATASTAIAWRIGLWDWNLTKDAIVLTGAVVFPMTFRSFSFKSGGALAHSLAKDTLGLTAIFAIYLEAAPLPLVGELILQVLATFLVILQTVARTRNEWLPVRRLVNVLLGVVGIFLFLWTTSSIFSSPPDWSETFQSILFSFWLPLSLLPFFYAFAFYAIAGKVLSRFQAIRKPLTFRRMLAFVIGTRFRLSLLAQFNGRYSSVANGPGFREGLRRMRDFRDDLKRRHQEEAERLDSLERHRDIPGVDEDGLHIDRREFDVTKKRLNWIWTCQNGQYEKHGDRYWEDLTDLIVDAHRHGLPTDHGFVVETADLGEVWRAWRCTPGGAVLGTGGAEHRTQYYFQGDAPPTGWPRRSDEWVDASQGTWPPDWNNNDGTPL